MNTNIHLVRKGSVRKGEGDEEKFICLGEFEIPSEPLKGTTNKVNLKNVTLYDTITYLKVWPSFVPFEKFVFYNLLFYKILRVKILCFEVQI